jgi:hypothetical protein
MSILQEALTELTEHNDHIHGTTAREGDLVVNIDGWEIIKRHHSLIRGDQRNVADDIIDDLLTRVVKRLNMIVNRITKPGEYLLFSSGLNRGIVCDVNPPNKKIRVMTTLPAGHDFALAGTKKLIIEGVQYEVIEID